MTLITDEVRQWADRMYPDYEFDVTARDIQRFAHATGETDPIHFERDAAIAAGYEDVVAPPLFPYIIRMHASCLVDRTRIADDGSPVDDVPPVPSRRAMAGQVSIDIRGRIVAGDVITVRKRITDLYEKEGRSGPLVFVDFEYTFHDQRGDLVATERFTRIYR